MVPAAEPANAAAALKMAGRLGEIVGRHRETAQLCEALHEQLSTITPGLTMVVYELDKTLDALHVRAASGFTGARSTASRSSLAPGSRAGSRRIAPRSSTRRPRSTSRTGPRSWIPAHGSVSARRSSQGESWSASSLSTPRWIARSGPKRSVCSRCCRGFSDLFSKATRLKKRRLPAFATASCARPRPERPLIRAFASRTPAAPAVSAPRRSAC